MHILKLAVAALLAISVVGPAVAQTQVQITNRDGDVVNIRNNGDGTNTVWTEGRDDAVTYGEDNNVAWTHHFGVESLHTQRCVSGCEPTPVNEPDPPQREVEARTPTERTEPVTHEPDENRPSRHDRND